MEEVKRDKEIPLKKVAGQGINQNIKRSKMENVNV